MEDSLLWRVAQLGIHHTATVRDPDTEEVVTTLAAAFQLPTPHPASPSRSNPGKSGPAVGSGP
ncbi:MAG: hypothetical protein OXC47_00585 [Cyanobacteria bacterium MAG APA_bin_95]|nr:hypothetical protein [Cyanobacteria bacterium MAG APA_bin_95]